VTGRPLPGGRPARVPDLRLPTLRAPGARPGPASARRA
jgi:hypothetical protein